MRKIRKHMVLLALKFIDWVLDVQRDKPVYLVFHGEGIVEIQRVGEQSKTFEL
jgi:hypothetical protein